MSPNPADVQPFQQPGKFSLIDLHNLFRNEIEQAPIMLLLDRSADVFLAKRAGADAYLIKPFTSQQLREVMSHLLPEASS